MSLRMLSANRAAKAKVGHRQTPWPRVSFEGDGDLRYHCTP